MVGRGAVGLGSAKRGGIKSKDLYAATSPRRRRRSTRIISKLYYYVWSHKDFCGKRRATLPRWSEVFSPLTVFIRKRFSAFPHYPLSSFAVCSFDFNLRSGTRVTEQSDRLRCCGRITPRTVGSLSDVFVHGTTDRRIARSIRR